MIRYKFGRISGVIFKERSELKRLRYFDYELTPLSGYYGIDSDS